MYIIPKSFVLCSGLVAALTVGAAERIAFVGDSITHDGRYLGFVQLAETLANPANEAQYLNLGICGDTTESVLKRWRKVVDAQPTDIIVMLGMNDTGVGTYYPNAKPDVLEKRAARLSAYEINLREIVRKAKRLTPSVRLMTPSPYDEYGNWQKGGARYVGADSEGLASCVKSVRVIAREENVPVAEVHDPFALAARNSPDQRLGGADRVHPVDGGHLIMAACVVRSRRGCDGEMSPTVWDAAKGLSFDYRPARFGFPRVKGMDELDKTTELGKILGRETLVVKNLAKGTYRLFADGTSVGFFTEADLAAGLDLQKLDTPSARQAMKAAKIAERYSQVQSDLQYVALVDGMIAKYGSTDAWVLATKSNATNVAWSRHHAKHKPLVGALWDECAATPAKLSAACLPVSCRFELKPCTDRVVCAAGEPLAAAVERARATGARRIVVADGTHPARKTTFLDGRDDCLEIVAAPGAKPVFDGGLVLPKATRTADGLLEFDLVAAGAPEPHEPFRAYGTGVSDPRGASYTDLYRNGRLMHPAVEPNEGYALTTERVGAPHESSFRGTIDATALVGEKNLVAHGYWHWGWSDQTVPVTVTADAKGPVLHLQMPPTNSSVFAEVLTNQPYRMMGSKRFLDRKDEWFFDRAAGKAYVLPDREDDTFVLTANRGPLVVVNGTRHLRLKGLTFRYGCADGLVVSDAADFVFEGNLVERFASWGLKGKGLANAVLSRNVWRTFGAGGAMMRGGDIFRLVPGNNVFSDNDVSDTANRIRSGCHGLNTHGCGNAVVHNLFHDMPMAGVRMDGVEILVASNVFERVTTEADDWGAVECYGSPFFRGKVLHNVFRDVGPKGRCVVGSAGVRFDDQISGMLVWGNLFENCSRGKFGGVQINGGRENVIENNRFVNCHRALSVSGWPKQEKWLPHWHPNTYARVPMFDPFSPRWQERYGDLRRLRDEPQVNVFRHNELVNVAEPTAELTRWPSTVVAEDNDGLVEPLPPESALGPKTMFRSR